MKKQTYKIMGYATIIVVCLLYIGNYFYRENQSAAYYEELKEEVYIEDEEPNIEEVVAKEETTLIPIDFSLLQQQNQDIYAWIEIPDTLVNYPVVQSDDDTYYLNHTIDGVEGLPGSIYTEGATNQEFLDFNTIIYGHNMKQDAMFGGLKKFRDREYLEAHPLIYVYTPTKIRTYEIFAVVTFDDRHLLGSYNYTIKEGREGYLEDLKTVRTLDSLYLEEVPVDQESRILTLSTCIANKPEQRLLIGAVLIDEK